MAGHRKHHRKLKEIFVLVFSKERIGGLEDGSILNICISVKELYSGV